MSVKKDRAYRAAVAYVHARAHSLIAPGLVTERDAHNALMWLVEVLGDDVPDPSMSPIQAHVIRHALGVEVGRPRSGGYRNRYVAGPGQPHIDAAVSAGWLVQVVDGNYAVTQSGATAARCDAAWRRYQRSR